MSKECEENEAARCLKLSKILLVEPVHQEIPTSWLIRVFSYLVTKYMQKCKRDILICTHIVMNLGFTGCFFHS